MKNIIIIGAGGFGREVYSYLLDDIEKGYLSDSFKGFLDDIHENFLNLHLDEVDYLGVIDAYLFQPNDYVIVAIGNLRVRNMIIEKLSQKGINFYGYIHSSVFVAFDAVLEEGVLVCPNSMIQSNSIIKKHAILNIFCSVGHDTVLGESSILSPYCTLNGGVIAGQNLFMGTRSTVLLQSKIGDNCSISAHSVVRGVVESGMMIQDRPEQKRVKNRLI